ncbi:MAG: hypothetical protein KIH03_00200 [Paludibacteraceae bacterium]|nr:hypothetical protein [Paludibacteraceae bacterium]
MKPGTILCPSVEIFLLLKKRIPQPDPFLISMRLKRILLILLSDSWMMDTKQTKKELILLRSVPNKLKNSYGKSNEISLI